MDTETEPHSELVALLIYANEWQKNRILIRLACVIEATPEMTIHQFLTAAKANIESDPRQKP